MSRSVLRGAALAIASTLLLAACAAAPPVRAPTPTAVYCTRMVTNSGGLDDRSFNQSSWAGLQQAAKKFGVLAEVLVSTGETDLAPNVAQAVASGCDFVLTVGYELAAATEAQAKANPGVNFAIVDEIVQAKNVKPIVFDTAQASFLAGYLAAGVSKTGKVGTFGGGNQPPVTLFMDGFVDGVARYNQVHGAAVQVLGWDKKAQNGSFTGDFVDVNKGKSFAQALIDQGADVLLPVAGQVGQGAAATALEAKNVSLIWVDNDGYLTLPAEYRPIVLTSVLKNTADAVVSIVGDDIGKNFSNTPYVGTLKNGGVGLAPFHELASRVPAALKGEIDQLRSDIVSGKLTVTSPSTPR